MLRGSLARTVDPWAPTDGAVSSMPCWACHAEFGILRDACIHVQEDLSGQARSDLLTAVATLLESRAAVRGAMERILGARVPIIRWGGGVMRWGRAAWCEVRWGGAGGGVG